MPEDPPDSISSSNFEGLFPDGTASRGHERGTGSDPLSSGGVALGKWTPLDVEEVARLLPQYEILSLLGRGGMGAVYEGRQIALDRRVAIKFLPLEISIHQDFVDRFVREARAMARLEHPNIVAVHDFGQTSEGHLYFVMEFVNGMTLRQVLQAQGQTADDALLDGEQPQPVSGCGLPAEVALGLVVQVCEALAYAHSEGIVHRDIKPPNVLFDQRGRVKVADFGLARLIDPKAEDSDLTFTGLVMGSADYMAPEQRRGMKVDHRADIYSTGVMLYELLTGEVPRGAFRPASECVPTLDSRLDRIIQFALQTTPEDRYQSSLALRDDLLTVRDSVLETLPADEAAVAPVPTPQVVVARFPQPKKSPWLPIGVAAGVVALGVSAVALWPAKRKPAHAPAAALPGTQKVVAPERASPPTEEKPDAAPPSAVAVGPSAEAPRLWLISKTSAATPPGDALEFQGSKYQLVREDGTWIEAKAKAESMGGHLATITTAGEQDWITKQFGNAFGETTWFWLGGFISPGETKTLWVSGETSDYSAWRDKEPSLIANAESALPTAVASFWSAKYPAPAGWATVVSQVKKKGFLVEWDRYSAADAAANDPNQWRAALKPEDVEEANRVGTWSTSNLSFSDGAVRARFEAAGGPRMNITLRSKSKKDADHNSLACYYAAELNRDGVMLSKKVFNVTTQKGVEGTVLASRDKSKSIPRSGTHVLEFRAIGDLLSLYLDGELLTSVRDTTYPSGSVTFTTKGSTRSEHFCRVTEFTVLNLDSVQPLAPTVVAAADKPAPAVSATPAPQPAPAQNEYEKWLATVDAKMKGDYRREVGVPFDVEVAKHQKNFLAALDQQIAVASNGGHLDAAVAWRAERQRFLDAMQNGWASDRQAGGEIPSLIAASLTSLRAQLQNGLAKAEEARLKSARTLYGRYEAELSPGIPQLTKRQRLDDALQLKNLLAQAKVDWLESQAKPGQTPLAPSASTPARGGTPQSQGAPRSPTASLPGSLGSPSATPVVKGDDRKAAEWVLRAGGTVTIQERTSTFEVKQLHNLPKRTFSLTEVDLDFTHRSQKEPVPNLELLAGLEHLTTVEVGGLPFIDQDLVPLTKIPHLARLSLTRAEITDDVVDKLLAMPPLEKLSIDVCRNFTGSRLGELTTRKLRELSFFNTPLVPASYGVIGGIDRLTTLDLVLTPATDDDLIPIAKLSNLEELRLGRCAVTLKGLSLLRKLKDLKTLGWDFTPGKGPDELLHVSRLFPKLTRYDLYTVDDTAPKYSETDISALAVFPDLQEIHVSGTCVGDDGVRGLLALKKLQTYWNFDEGILTDAGLATLAKHSALQSIDLQSPFITDAGLLGLAPLRKLDYLTIENCPQLTDEGIRAFSRLRPDVGVTK